MSAPPMKIHRSNRTEKLVEALVGLIDGEPLDPMVPEIIAVQGRGMERWLSLQVAQKLGSGTNLEFPFPRAAIEKILSGALGEEAAKGAKRYRPEHLVFDILALLPGLLSDPRFGELTRYLEEEPIAQGQAIGKRALALCERIARVFDGYFTYRPEMILRWQTEAESESEEGWQPALFRALRERIDAPSFPEIVKAATTTLAPWRSLERGDPRLDALPRRLSFFGISTLPPLYLDLLAAMPIACEVHLFLLTPSDHYWADTKDKRAAARELAKSNWQKSLDELAISLAHPLLESFGKVGKEFQLVLLQSAGDYEDGAELFETPKRTNLLTALQADLREKPASPPGAEEEAQPPAPSSERPSSPSIQIHACHGKTRQVEVLRDALVRLFDELPNLEPRDVVVMAPEIDDIAPIIEAVFSDGDEGERSVAGFPKLPYRIADRPASTENPVAEALIALLALARSRMRAPEVLAFLGMGPVARKFGVDTRDLGTLRRWIDETGIRWGEDKAHRQSHGVDIGEGQSFREGLDRMLLGHAMRGEGTRLFEGRLGYEDASDSRLLGALVSFTSCLFDTVQGFRKASTLREFQRRVTDAMERLFETPAGERWQPQLVRKVLDELVQAQPEVSTSLILSPEALATLVEVPLRGASSDSFASGAITFCAMVPMRSVPFRVVCLLGMDDGAFPRKTTKDGFDLTASSPRPGDRRLEDDDRYLVLEALLSARDRLLVFYSGRDIENNAKIPPIAPISELLEAMAKTMRVEGPLSERARREIAEERYVVEHPLQAFGPASFSKEAKGRISTQSYDKRRLEAAEALLSKESSEEAFFTEALPSIDIAQVSVDDLARFFADPVQAFFSQRLGVRFRDGEGEIDDRERLELSKLESYVVHDAALGLLRQGEETSRIEDILRARSILPFGVSGTIQAREAISATSGWQETIRSFEEGGRREPIGVDLQFGDLSVTGRLREVYAKGRLRVTWSKQKPQRRIEEWVRHIVYCAQESEAAGASILIERDGSKGKENEPIATIWERIPDAREKLATLLALWKEGMSAPLLFFAEPAKAYAAEMANGKVPEEEREAKAIEKAWKAWAERPRVGDDTLPALRENPYYARLFADTGRELFTNDFVWGASERRFPQLVKMIWEASEAVK